MKAPPPGAVSVGDQVRFGDGIWTVRQVSGALVGLSDVAGSETEVALSVLLAHPGFQIISSRPSRAPLPERGWLEGLPSDAAEMARTWERHIVEVLRGVPADAPRGTRPREGYDPAAATLRQREIAKVAELAADGTGVSLSNFQRRRRAYEREGLLGLVDGRTRRRVGSTVDPRVLDAIRKAIAEQTNRSTGTVGRVRRS